MDKHTQPRITHRASRPGDMRIACLCTRELSLWAASCTCALTRSRNAHERSLFTAPTTETIDHHPRSTSTISDMVANICRAKHTNTIQYCLPTASGAQPFWSTLLIPAGPVCNCGSLRFTHDRRSLSRSVANVCNVAPCWWYVAPRRVAPKWEARVSLWIDRTPCHMGWCDRFVTFSCQSWFCEDGSYMER